MKHFAFAANPQNRQLPKVTKQSVENPKANKQWSSAMCQE